MVDGAGVRRRGGGESDTVVLRAPSSLPVPLIQHRHIPSPRLGVALIAVALTLGAAQATETWRGLVVAEEHRCAPYDRDDYPYPQSVEREIVARMGGRIYRPYTGRHFDSRQQTDIEHMVAAIEAHDSGLCAAGAGTRARFIAVRQKYPLTVDARAAAALDGVLAGCASTDLVVYASTTEVAAPATQVEEGAADPLER